MSKEKGTHVSNHVPLEKISKLRASCTEREKKKMENFEQLVRKTMKEHGIDARLTKIILSNKSPEEITKAIEKAVFEIVEEKKKAEFNVSFG